MTAQIPDCVWYRDDDYRIIGIKGERLLTPLDFGITPVMMSTACYRGYQAFYTCIDQQLLLTALTVRTKDNHYLPIHGVKAEIGGTFNAGQYSGLREPVPYSGALLLGKDFIQSMYVHMGFQKPISYATVIQLVLDNGKIVAETDFSEKIAQLREARGNSTNGSRPVVRPEDINKWVEWMFSLDYDLDL